ncbi:MAG: GntR family transcriptional regulator [Desulfobulbaceae bacterium]|nr:GntR family transcriptional regulator [Desulfobulbaceae bacterium]
MVRIGRINKLSVKTTLDSGVFLAGGEAGDILLPRGEAPDPCRPGDEVVVFVYLDGEDRPRATTQKPLLTVGRFAGLRVVATTTSGAYLDWGVPKDLFVPLSEQPVKMVVGGVYAVFAYLDEKTGRIIASAKLDKFLDSLSAEYVEGEEVDLLIYAQTELGYKAVINQAHGGLLHKSEVFRPLAIGQELPGYIKKLRLDGKIDLSLQAAGYQGVDAIARDIFATLKEQGGRIAVTDKSPPAEIYARFGVSKKSFKKAIGALYQKRLICIDPEGISLVR